MGLFDHLFGNNPTSQFPVPAQPVSLVWHTEEHHLNGIRLGCDVTALAPLGPCPKFHRLGKRRFNCIYPALGLDLEFCLDQLESITLFISEDELNPVEPGTAYATLRIRPAGLILTPDMNGNTLSSLFGKFELGEKDEEEMIGTFFSGKMCYEAEFAHDARLKKLNLYLDE